MPLLILIQPGKPLKHNAALSAETRVHFCDDSVLISEGFENERTKDLLFCYEENTKSKYVMVERRGIQVIKPGNFGIGDLEMSDSFGPCQIILAKLKNNKFALYHCPAHLFDTSSAVDFYKRIKKDFELFYFFTRTSHPQKEKTDMRTNSLYLDLVALVGKDRVINFEVPNYCSVIADGIANQIFVCTDNFGFASKEKIGEMLAEEKNNIVLDPVVTQKSFAAAKNEMTEILRSVHFMAGDNAIIREIRELLLEERIANARSDEKKPVARRKIYEELSDDEEDVVEEGIPIKELVLKIFEKYLEKIKVQYSFLHSSKQAQEAKAEKINRILQIALSHHPALTDKELNSFFAFKERGEPSLKEILTKNKIFTQIDDEIKKEIKKLHSPKLSF